MDENKSFTIVIVGFFVMLVMLAWINKHYEAKTTTTAAIKMEK